MLLQQTLLFRAWEMLMEEEEMNIKKFAASKASTLEAAKAAAARKLK